MNSKLLLLVATGGVALLFAADQPKEEPGDLEKLKARVTLLEGRIDLLDARLQFLTQMSRTSRTAFGSPQSNPNHDSSVPPNIGEIEVNGLKVYKVPLSQKLEAEPIK